MPRQILFVQGAGEAVHDQWDSKLVRSLERELGDGYTVRYPRMPHEADPSYAGWKAVLLHEMDRLGDGAILIGHSVGGTILLHTLAEERPKFRPAALILIAPPFVGEGGWPGGDIDGDADFAVPEGLPAWLYHGTEDATVPAAHARLYEKSIPGLVVRSLPNRDHQLNNDLSEVAADIRRLVDS